MPGRSAHGQRELYAGTVRTFARPADFTMTEILGQPQSKAHTRQGEMRGSTISKAPGRTELKLSGARHALN
jgi:hypothetical protein